MKTFIDSFCDEPSFSSSIKIVVIDGWKELGSNGIYIIIEATRAEHTVPYSRDRPDPFKVVRLEWLWGWIGPEWCVFSSAAAAPCIQLVTRVDEFITGHNQFRNWIVELEPTIYLENALHDLWKEWQDVRDIVTKNVQQMPGAI